METVSRGIPTKYKGTMFRSRIEARWAMFFDQLGWRWCYEPEDFDGYIPDFVLLFKHPVYVECKAASTIEELEKLGEKALRLVPPSRGEVLLLGSCPLGEDWSDIAGMPEIGLFRDGWFTDRSPAEWGWDRACLMRCRKCHRVSVFCVAGAFTCRVNGCWEGDHYLGCFDDVHGTKLKEIWAEVTNKSQWKRGRRGR